MSVVDPIRKLCSRYTSDRLYLQLQYYRRNKGWLNLRSPRGITEKFQWLKLYYRKPELRQVVNKYDCRPYVAERIDESHLPKLIAKYDTPEEIDWDNLPEQFAMKVAHGCAMNILCKDKSQLDRAEAIEKLRYWQSIETPCVTRYREWAYGGGSRVIIVEEFLENDEGKSPEDYKFYCFNGEPKFAQFDADRFGNHARGYYDMDWQTMPFDWDLSPKLKEPPPRPKHLDKMIEIARALSADLPFARIDLYEVGDRVMFGEITLYPGAGYGVFNPTHYDKIVGDMLELPAPYPN